MDKQPVAVKLGGIYAVLRFDEVFFWLSIFSGCASHLVVHFGSLYGTPSSNIKKKSIRKSMDVSYSKMIEQMD